MKKLSLFLSATLLAVLTGHSHSTPSCDTDHLKATYNIEREVINKPPQTTELVLWRKGNNHVMHQYPQTGISQYWFLAANNRIQAVRYFDNHQRAIEYQAGESVHGKQEKDWSYRYQLISKQLLSGLTKTSTEGDGCGKREHYTGNANHRSIKMTWLPELELVQHFELSTPKFRETWQLQQDNHDPERVNRAFAKRSHYQTTDFADIGDDHHDPFLTQMVNLGFIEHGASGFYDDKGNALEGEHKH